VNDLIEKLTPYNLFNYLLPGTVFSYLASSFTDYTFIQSDLFVAFFAYYLTGMVISRVGSLIIEPFLKKYGFIKFAPYSDFVRCSKIDDKLNVLSEANNTYRTITTLFISLGALKVVELILARFSAPEWLPPLALCIFLFGLFLMAYRKQTSYIKKRIESTDPQS
jgi:hypothetical protein